MGLENMRRWPMYIIFAVCILLTLSLLNSWNLETELRNRINDISRQLQQCSKQQTTCMEESLTLLEQRDSYSNKVTDLNKHKTRLEENLSEYRAKLAKSEIQINNTKDDVNMCKTELQSLKNLHVSESAMLETLRSEKKQFTSQLATRKQKIEDLEKEIEKLRLALTTKSAPNPPVPSKVTPAAAPPKQSPALNVVQNPINEPVLENNAKEDIEDPNIANDAQDFDTQF